MRMLTANEADQADPGRRTAQAAERPEAGQGPSGHEPHPQDGQEPDGSREPMPEVGQLVAVHPQTTAIITWALRLSFRLP